MLYRFAAWVYRTIADFYPQAFGDLKARRRMEATTRGNILIACSHFWPSIGGVESRLEQFSARLVKAGYRVTVITPAFPGRESDTRNGVSIRSIPAGRNRFGLSVWPYCIRAAITSGEYDTCILVQDPRGVILWTLQNLPVTVETRILVQPIITADGYERWKCDDRFTQGLAAVLQRADAAVAMTVSGPDADFMRRQGIQPKYIPNATKPPASQPGFRERHAIAADAFMIVHAANLWWYKNHIGLLDALPDLPSDVKLVMIGNPTAESDCVEAVTTRLAERREILYLAGCNRDDVSSAMAETDLVVLSSLGEGSPNTILEAMSHAKPWLATPDCGGASDNAGGLICRLSDFGEYVDILRHHADIRRALAQLGYRHWQACFAWETVVPRWIDLIEGRPLASFGMPPDIAEELDQLRSRIEALRFRPSG